MKRSPAEVVGRDSELERLGAFVEAGFSPRALTLTGSPGIGKTTLWEAGIALARQIPVLTARPSGAEAQLSFAALIDLCEDLEIDALPAPQRSALEVALLRREPENGPPEPHAIGLGLRNALAARGPLLVAIDDVQWLDPPSAEALAFAARRLEEEPVGFLLARRPGEPSALEAALERRDLERVEVGPLGAGAIRRLLSERLGLRVPAPLLRQIVEATLGNPLFAIEVGRRLAADGLAAAATELPVPAAVEDLLGTRVAQLPAVTRRLLLAVALSAALQVAELETIASADAVDAALDSGVLLVDGDRVRAAHPLLAAAARARARPRERRALHGVLAGAVREPEQRALHSALATEGPDETLAVAISAAAATAAARGARPQAAALAEQALRLTPADGDERGERLLTLAAYWEATGERLRVRDLLEPELASLHPGGPRVRAWLLLSEAGTRTRAEYVACVEHALSEAGEDPGLRAHALALMALNMAAEGVERIPEADTWALEALPAGGEAEATALRALGWTRSLRGHGLDDVCERFRAASGGAAQIVDSPDPVAALRLAWRGELESARAATTGFLALAAERGEEVAYAWLRLNLCELELRAGAFDAAERLLDEWGESDDGQFLITPTYQRCRGLVAAGRGLADEAERWAAPALAEARARGFSWQVLEATRALGLAALLAHDPALAAERLRAVWEHTVREGVDEPGAFPVAPELVEALTELGELEEARAVTARLRTLSTEQAHPWGMVTAARCDALVRLAAGEHAAEPTAALARVTGEYERLGLRFDAARSLLSLGRAQRRLRQWRAAREALEAAAEAFDVLGAPGWADQARGELARVGGRRPRVAGELTEAERQVAALAAEGLANKEIAQALFVTVHTVEAHLSNTYAKLGVRSRAQLASRLDTS